jgi:hypothetical protein
MRAKHLMKYFNIKIRNMVTDIDPQNQQIIERSEETQKHPK